MVLAVVLKSRMLSGYVCIHYVAAHAPLVTSTRPNVATLGPPLPRRTPHVGRTPRLADTSQKSLPPRASQDAEKSHPLTPAEHPQGGSAQGDANIHLLTDAVRHPMRAVCLQQFHEGQRDCASQPPRQSCTWKMSSYMHLCCIPSFCSYPHCRQFDAHRSGMILTEQSMGDKPIEDTRIYSGRGKKKNGRTGSEEKGTGGVRAARGC